MRGGHDGAELTDEPRRGTEIRPHTRAARDLRFGQVPWWWKEAPSKAGGRLGNLYKFRDISDVQRVLTVRQENVDGPSGCIRPTPRQRSLSPSGFQLDGLKPRQRDPQRSGTMCSSEFQAG